MQKLRNMAKNVLIIDDNKKYTSMIRDRLEKSGCAVEHALSSRSGFDLLSGQQPNHFDIIITDITMETHVSGILLVRKIRKMGFTGCLVIYSTGFNYPIVLLLSRIFFRIMGADGLIPKNSLIDGEPFLTRISRHKHLAIIDESLM